MYVKLFQQMLDSTVNELQAMVRLVWIYLLLLADTDGTIDMTASAIARRTNLPIDDVRRGIEQLMQPDPESRSTEEEGRRLVPIREGYGWRVVNYEKYRALRTNGDRRDYFREYRRQERARKAGDVHTVHTPVHRDSQKSPKEDRQGKREARTSSSEPSSDAARLAELLSSLIRDRLPKAKAPNLQQWAIQIDRLIRIDGRTPAEVEAVVRWSQADAFWRKNILSAAKLREKFDQLTAHMQSAPRGPRALEQAPIYREPEPDGPSSDDIRTLRFEAGEGKWSRDDSTREDGERYLREFGDLIGAGALHRMPTFEAWLARNRGAA